MKIERILVALDASPHSLAALQAAADLADKLGAELRGLFIEDINLLRLAQLPVARELRYPRATSDKLDAMQMEAQLRSQGALAQRYLEEIAARRHLACSFSVMRGLVANTLLQAAQESDLLVLGRISYSLVRTTRLGSTAQTAVSQTQRSVLLMHPRADLSGPPLLIYDGSPAGERALSLAIGLTPRNGRLSILLYAPDDEDVQRLIEQISAQTEARQIEAAYRRLHRFYAQEVNELIQDSDSSLLILSDAYDHLSIAKLNQFMEQLTCPVLLVR
jgi:nucleotide-binding universal stress UspA family protein